MSGAAVPETAFASSTRNSWIGVGLMCLAMVFWTGMETLGHYVPRGVSPFQVVWTRYGVHLLFMLLVLAPRHGTALVRTGRPAWQIGRALLMLGMPACFVFGVLRLPVATVWALFWISPLLILGLAAALFAERASGVQWGAAFAGFAGALLFYRPALANVSLHWVWPLGMALCFSLYVAMTRRMRTEHRFANLFYTALGVFVPLTLVVPALWQAPGAGGWLAMSGIGLLGWASLFCLDKSLEHASPGVVAPFLLTQLIWSLAWDAAISGRLPGRSAAAGAGVVVAGLLGLALRDPALARSVKTV